MLSGGQIGTENYKDIRRFYSSKSFTTTMYIHLATLCGPSAMENISFLTSLPDLSSIDLIIFASYHMDLNL